MNHSRTRRLTALVLTMAFAAVCLAACGSSSSTSASGSAAASASSSTSSSSRSSRFGSPAARAKLQSCLKSHGVTLPSRPAGGNRPPSGSGSGSGSTTTPRRFFGGGGAGGGGGGAFANPKLRAALQACGVAGGFGGSRRSSLNHAAVTKFAACVKQHGYTLPAPNFSGKGPVFPASIESNKKFQAAAKACQSDLRPAGGPGDAPGGGTGGGAPPGGSSSSSTSSA